MQIMLNDRDISNNNIDLYTAYPSFSLDEFDANGREIMAEYYATEGVVWDVVKNTAKAANQVKKAGKAVYKTAKNQARGLKEKWLRFKPILEKAIKDLGITLSNMYGRFMKYDQDYKKLGQRIDGVIRNKIPMLRSVSDDILIDIYDISFNTLSNTCKLVESYEGFVAIVKNDKNLMNGRYIEAPDFYNMVKKGCDLSTGGFNSKYCQDKLNEMIQAVSDLNKNGETTIPNYIWTERKMTLPFSLPFMKNHNETLKKQKDMDASTAAGFTKVSITGGEPQQIDFSPEEIDDFSKLMVNGEKGYLNIMRSFLNNSIIEKTLKSSGSSIKKETKNFFNNMKKSTEELSKLMKQMQEIQVKQASGNKIDEDKGLSEEQIQNAKMKELSKKTLKNSNDGFGEPDADGIEEVVESYMQACLNFFMVTSNVYRGMVNGLLSASFDIIVNCKFILDKIDSLTVVDQKKLNEMRGGK